MEQITLKSEIVQSLPKDIKVVLLFYKTLSKYQQQELLEGISND